MRDMGDIEGGGERIKPGEARKSCSCIADFVLGYVSKAEKCKFGKGNRSTEREEVEPQRT